MTITIGKVVKMCIGIARLHNRCGKERYYENFEESENERKI